MANIYHEGDRLLIIHSHELHPPVMPRKYNLWVWWQGAGKEEGEGNYSCHVHCKLFQI